MRVRWPCQLSLCLPTFTCHLPTLPSSWCPCPPRRCRPPSGPPFPTSPHGSHAVPTSHRPVPTTPTCSHLHRHIPTGHGLPQAPNHTWYTACPHTPAHMHSPPPPCVPHRKADSCVQHLDACKLPQADTHVHGRLAHDGDAQHTRGQLGPRHAALTDRAPPADCGGDALQWQARVDAGRWPRARPREAAVHGWLRVRAARPRVCMADVACRGRGQWDVVGDTFVVGCQFPDTIIYPEMFAGNPDVSDAMYSTKCGVYKPGCRLDNGVCTHVVCVGMPLMPAGSDVLMGPQ